MSKPFDVVVPIKVNENKTIWHKIGTVFKNDREDKKHLMSISIHAIPLAAYTDGRIQAYVFPPREKESNSSQKYPPGYNPPEPPPNFYDDDVSF
jgi:hypothetical protein